MDVEAALGISLTVLLWIIVIVAGLVMVCYYRNEIKSWSGYEVIGSETEKFE